MPHGSTNTELLQHRMKTASITESVLNSFPIARTSKKQSFTLGSFLQYNLAVFFAPTYGQTAESCSPRTHEAAPQRYWKLQLPEDAVLR